MDLAFCVASVAASPAQIKSMLHYSCTSATSTLCTDYQRHDASLIASCVASVASVARTDLTEAVRVLNAGYHKQLRWPSG